MGRSVHGRVYFKSWQYGFIEKVRNSVDWKLNKILVSVHNLKTYKVELIMADYTHFSEYWNHYHRRHCWTWCARWMLTKKTTFCKTKGSQPRLKWNATEWHYRRIQQSMVIPNSVSKQRRRVNVYNFSNATVFSFSTPG